MRNEPETRKKGERPHMDYQMDENTELGCCSGTWEEADEYARKKNKGDYIILE